MNKKAEFLQVTYLDFDSPTGDHLRRGRKIYRESLPKQKKLNEKRAKRYFEALIEANFKGGRDLVLHLTFNQEDYPESEAEAKKRVQGFLRNISGKGVVLAMQSTSLCLRLPKAADSIFTS